MRHPRRFVALGLLGGAQVFGGAIYQIVDLGVSVPTFPESGPGINNVGQITFGTPTQAVVWTAGVATPLPLGNTGFGCEINDGGTVVGQSTPLGPAEWVSGIAHSLNSLLPGAPDRARSVNNQGRVVAWSHNAASDNRTYVFDGTTMLDIGTLGTFCYGEDIDDNGTIVGYSRQVDGPTRAFSWTSGGMAMLPVAPGSDTFAYGINNAGQIVGTIGQLTPFLFDGHTTTTLAAAPSSDLNRPVAIGMNGNAVGFSRVSGRGFVAEIW